MNAAKEFFDFLLGRKFIGAFGNGDNISLETTTLIQNC